jgi:CHAD domain-containing protein
MRALRSHDTVHGAIQLNVARSTGVCIRLLTGKMSSTLTDDAVHEIRTRLKKLRALLRLVRTDLGETRYQRAKRGLQQASHPLAGIRDARVLLTTCEKVLRRWDGTDHVRLHATLGRRLDSARQKASPGKRRAFAMKLATVGQLIADWPESQAGWKSLSGGLRHVYARGRHAFETAGSAPSDTHLHDLRKRAKDLLYMCAFLRRGSPHARSLSTDLDRFADLLGADHDLAILYRTAARGKLAHKPPLRKQLCESATRQRKRLRKQAWRIGSRIYNDPPAAFLEHIHRDWQDWR